MSLDEVTKLIQFVGFPVFVSLWFMFRLEKKMEQVIELLSRAVDEDNGGEKSKKEDKHVRRP